MSGDCFSWGMKSAYELAMERLEAADDKPHKPLTESQKEKLQEIHQSYEAKIADRMIFLEKTLKEAEAGGDAEALGQIREQMRLEKTRLEEEREAEKEKVRASF